MRRARPPAPSSISQQAQAYLNANRVQLIDEAAFPDLPDHEGWRRWVSEFEGPVREAFSDRVPGPEHLAHALHDAAGVPTYELVPARLRAPHDAPLFIDFHGGAFIMCGGELSWMMAASKALDRDGVTWAPDYRMPPDHPFPAALDDCVAVYEAALRRWPAHRIVVRGASAGGNLAAATLLRARDAGLPMPAACVLITPEVDLTESGDSFRTAPGANTLMPVNLLYANGHAPDDPYLSPLFGDLRGFPPTLVTTGSRDVFLSNAVRMHRALLAADVEAELHVMEAMPHEGFGLDSPEDQDLSASVKRFEESWLSASGLVWPDWGARDSS